MVMVTLNLVTNLILAVGVHKLAHLKGLALRLLLIMIGYFVQLWDVLKLQDPVANIFTHSRVLSPTLMIIA